MEGDDTDTTGLSRRSVLQTAGLLAGAGVLGSGAAAAASDDGALDPRLLNWRAVEAAKVWEKGYRGRPDRALAITDSGLDARHPDLGPWNGVRAITKDGDLVLKEGAYGDSGSGSGSSDGSDSSGDARDQVGNPLTRSGTAMPGAFVASAQASETATEPFNLADASAGSADEMDAELTWTPAVPANDLELRFERKVDGGWAAVKTAATASTPETMTVPVSSDETYRFVVERYANVAAQFDITATFFELPDLTGSDDEDTDTSEPDPLASVPGGPDPDVGADTPKTIGWYTSGDYGGFDVPKDQNGHGTHVASIQAGSGRASTIDPERTRTEIAENDATRTLLPGDFLEYEVTAQAGTSVFATGIAQNVEFVIIGPDGQQIEGSPLRRDSLIVDHPTVHDDGEATYTIRAKPWETEPAVTGAAERAQSGNPTLGRVKRLAVGTTQPPADAHGEREAAEQALHPGVSPDSSLVGFQGLGSGAKPLADHADEFADRFNIRSVNMSWGPLQGAPLGAAAGNLSETPAQIRQIAEGGILTVASAGNSFTPANGNGGPAVADEAISVVATGPFDGVTSYSSGGIGGADEDTSNEGDGPVYGKPDVTAPGGDVVPDAVTPIGLGTATGLAPVSPPVGVGYPVPALYELARAAKNGDPTKKYAAGDPPRDYTDKAGTSMSSPYTNGIAGLLAQAMEQDAPDALSLPEPTDTEFADVMRLKQVLLATASETAFTAAPYHAVKNVPSAPTYTFGERDPFEGYGRVNPDTAVDAVTRDLTPAMTDGEGSNTIEGTVGLDVPHDSRAVAGYVAAPPGSLDVSVSVTGLSGGNAGMAKGPAHVDLFVYDGETPAANGEPNIVARAQGPQGAPSASVSVPGESGDDLNHYLVVAKLVNVPGVVNGFDVQANLDLSVSLDATQETFSATGSRTDDGSTFQGGQINQVDLTVTPDADAEVRDLAPSGWDVLTDYGDAVGVTGTESGQYVTLDPNPDDSDRSIPGGSETTLTYFVRAPESLADSNRYGFGPVEARPAGTGDDAWVSVPGTTDANNLVVGTSPPSSGDSLGTSETPDSPL